MASLQIFRSFRTSCAALQRAIGQESHMELFDGVLKAAHRDRASLYPPEPDPLLDEVADRLVDRLQDCTRSFSNALLLGGAGYQVLKTLQRSGPAVEAATVVDTSKGMLARARLAWNASEEVGHGKIETNFVLADASKEVLPVDPGSFDVVISCLGLHWVNDVPTVMMQCRAALRPDGLFLAAMLGGTTLQELRIACTLAQQEREGGVAPRTSPLAQVRDAGNLLTRAGLTIPTVDVDDINVGYPDPIALVRHLRRMGESNALLQRREALPRDTALAAAAAYVALFGSSEAASADEAAEKAKSEMHEDGDDDLQGITATYQVVYMTGWAPDPSQKKAAKRGSATVSLQDLSRDLGSS